MRHVRSYQTQLVFSLLVILIGTGNIAGQETSVTVDLNIGVSLHEKFDFKINNFEDQEYLIDDIIFLQDYYGSNESILLEDTFSINITRIESESSRSVCYTTDDINDCIYYTPEIYVDLTSGSSSFYGMVSVSATPFGDLITTTDWDLVEEELMKLENGGSDGFLEYDVLENSFRKDSDKVTIDIDIKATFIQNDTFFSGWESIAVNGTTIYDTKTGVLQSTYSETQITFTNGTTESDVQDISNMGYDAGGDTSNIGSDTDGDDTLSLPILTLNQTILYFLPLSLLYYKKRK